jgi:hypothetical protein
VIERRRGERFVLQSVALDLVGSDIIRQELQGNITSQFRVVRAVHDAHATGTKFRNDPVLAERATDHRPLSSAV